MAEATYISDDPEFLDVCSLGLEQFPYRLLLFETDVDLDPEKKQKYSDKYPSSVTLWC